MDSAEPPLEPAGQKRLAVILAVDVAGYSARSELDQAGAVRAVQALARRIEAAALAGGGRVFNAAGDGFMLEFPSVSGALTAAAAIVRDAETPVRIGVHLGEVLAMTSGDLLGHGVNVAARLQALARPGSVLVSEAVRRSVTGAEEHRFRRHGRIRLDKMSQAAEVFTVDLASRPGGVRRRRPWAAPALAAAATLVLVAAGLSTWRMAQPPSLRVAVEPIVPSNRDALAASVADGLAERISAGLADHRSAVTPVQIAARAKHGGARLVVSGETHRDGDTLSIDIQLADQRRDLLLWSSHFQRPVSESAALAEEAAAKVVDVVAFAVKVMRDPNVHADSETLGAMLKLADLVRETDNTDQLIELDRQLLRLAPRYSPSHSGLAVDLATAAGRERLPPEVANVMAEEARAEAAEALRLNPHDELAYGALNDLLPRTDFVDRAAFLTKALQVDPDSAAANDWMAQLLRDVGRNREAEPLYRRALALDPLSPSAAATLIFGLAGTGRVEEAWALAQHAMILFPYGSSVRKGYVYMAALYHKPDVAIAAIDKVERLGGVFDSQGGKAWRDFVNGARRRPVDPAAVRRFRQAALSGVVDPSNAAPALALAGDLDGAFATFGKALDEHVRIYPAYLFETAAAPMRRDPRFEPLVKRLGIYQYWVRSRVPPDFCRVPDPPPVCRGLPGAAL